MATIDIDLADVSMPTRYDLDRDGHCCIVCSSDAKKHSALDCLVRLSERVAQLERKLRGDYDGGEGG